MGKSFGQVADRENEKRLLWGTMVVYLLEMSEQNGSAAEEFLILLNKM